MRDIPIDNWVPPVMVVAFGIAAVILRVPDGLLGHLVLGAGAFALGFLVFSLGWCGGGLVKFFAAASLWIGPNAAFFTFVAVVLIGGGAFALVSRALRRSKLDSVPFMPVVLFAFAATLPQAPIWHAVTGSMQASV